MIFVYDNPNFNDVNLKGSESLEFSIWYNLILENFLFVIAENFNLNEIFIKSTLVSLLEALKEYLFFYYPRVERLHCADIV